MKACCTAINRNLCCTPTSNPKRQQNTHRTIFTFQHEPEVTERERDRERERREERERGEYNILNNTFLDLYVHLQHAEYHAYSTEITLR